LLPITLPHEKHLRRTTHGLQRACGAKSYRQAPHTSPDRDDHLDAMKIAAVCRAGTDTIGYAAERFVTALAAITRNACFRFS